MHLNPRFAHSVAACALQISARHAAASPSGLERVSVMVSWCSFVSGASAGPSSSDVGRDGSERVFAFASARRTASGGPPRSIWHQRPPRTFCQLCDHVFEPCVAGHTRQHLDCGMSSRPPASGAREVLRDAVFNAATPTHVVMASLQQQSVHMALHAGVVDGDNSHFSTPSKNLRVGEVNLPQVHWTCCRPASTSCRAMSTSIPQ